MKLIDQGGRMAHPRQDQLQLPVTSILLICSYQISRGEFGGINFVCHDQKYINQSEMALWRLALRIAQPLSVSAADRAKLFRNPKLLKYSLVPIACTSLFYYLRNRQLTSTYPEDTQSQIFSKSEKDGRVVTACKYIYRVLELSIIFAPSVICLPLYLFSLTRDWWIGLFLKAIQRAGAVWIKTFQYLSHRRDIIGEDIASKFQVLREHAPTHIYQQTLQIIRRVYSKQIYEMFEYFQQQPVASGSISQVYRAKLGGRNVAVKVRHPEVGKNIERDIDLMFAFSRVLSKLSKFFEIPVTEVSLKNILTSQLSFLQEKKNIDTFNTMAIDKDVRFPSTYPQSTNEVLIQQFIQGHTIGFYEHNVHNLNRVIANIGAKAFFSMLMKHNFVHADCHAGNIMVKINQQPYDLPSQLNSYLNSAKNYLISQILRFGFDSPYLRKLSYQNYQYQKQVQGLVDKFKQRVEVVLIDVGMAIRMTKEKKLNFQNFLAEIIKGDPAECAKWIYRISEYNGQKLREFDNQQYLQDLEVMFRRVHQTTLESLQGIQVLLEMLSVIRSHNMKIDGDISILLTNMLVLEQIAKDLDPSINILRCAVPYLHYK